MDSQKSYLISQITGFEWTFFQAVQNEGGRAECQDNYYGFQVSREAQFEAWTNEMLKSYLADISTAVAQGRNLVEEKYARMMSHTAPEKYALIRNYLPTVSTKATNMIQRICEIHVKWSMEAFKKYPALSGQGRVVKSSSDRKNVTSLETYLAAELATYSEKTLGLYLSYIDGLVKEGKNLSLLILENTVRHYGYASLQEAEEKYGGTR